ncbi:MAG: hypothetical protein KGQ41_00825 [Alphaproteobacteria bacterium]|nr:hypothetical protein [Alphaproteobacteria bacterium]
MTELAPNFEAVLMPHDGNVEALARLSSTALLPVDVARTVLVSSEKYPYAPVKAPDGRPYFQTPLDGVLKRYYMFVNPEAPYDATNMLALQCNVIKEVKTGIIVVTPEALLRGSEADAALSIKFGCCAGGRTMVYTDRKASGQVFLRVAFSGADVRSEMQTIWRGLKLVTLDEKGMAALAHMVADMRGTCQGHTHAQKADYTRTQNWGRAKLGIS